MVRRSGLDVLGTICLLSFATSIDAADKQHESARVSARKSGEAVVVESSGGPITYKAVIDEKTGGNITRLNLPADGPVVARELNDIFFHGNHDEEYTLRGWTGRDKCLGPCSAEIVSQKRDEVTVRVKMSPYGTFKVLLTEEPAKTELRSRLKNYTEKTIDIDRTYVFKPDRIVSNDEIRWIHPRTKLTSLYFTAAFTPRTVQGPARLVKGDQKRSFYLAWSSGDKLPEGITYPFISENYLKNGYKVSLRTDQTSLDLANSDMYFYERTWQQDWYQVSGFKFRADGHSPERPVTMSTEIGFSKAALDEMPPVVTIHSPGWDDRWLDEVGEVPKHRVGETLKLSASAVNADGSAVPDQDISWDIHIDPWFNTPSDILQGRNPSYTIPDVTNAIDREKAKNRNLFAIIQVKAIGKNGTEAVEAFSMLVAKAP